MYTTLLRLGHFDTLMYIPLRDLARHTSIMCPWFAMYPIGVDVDVDAIGESNRCEGFSGAGLALLVSLD